jgi:hypothetical protein
VAEGVNNDMFNNPNNEIVFNPDQIVLDDDIVV